LALWGQPDRWDVVIARLINGQLAILPTNWISKHLLKLCALDSRRSGAGELMHRPFCDCGAECHGHLRPIGTSLAQSPHGVTQRSRDGRRRGTNVSAIWSRARCARSLAKRISSRTRCATIWNVATPSSSRKWRRFCASIELQPFRRDPVPERVTLRLLKQPHRHLPRPKPAWPHAAFERCSPI
jgi:hypothetical protein